MADFLLRQVELYPRCVAMWDFSDAPEYFRYLTAAAGLEGLVIYVPTGLDRDGRAVGLLRCRLSEHLVPGGKLYIGT